MLRVNPVERSRVRWFVWIPLAVMSLAIHVGFFLGATTWAETKPREPFESSRVEFRAVEPPPELQQEPLPEPEPEPEIAKPKPRPRPNTSKPAPRPEPTEPSQEVFGVTADSVVAGGSGVAVRVGNTLAKEMEAQATKPKDVAPLPPAPPEPKPEPKPEKKKPIKPVPVYELSKAPKFKKKIEPKYPAAAKRDGIEGTVQLEVLIDEQGRVRKIRVLKSPGHGLDRAAIAAVSKSRFHPGFVNGKAVPVKIKIPYRFVLDA